MKVKPEKLYELTVSETNIFMAIKYSIKKNVCQVPSYLLFEEKLDFSLMKKAFDIACERNDFMRLRFVKAKNETTGKKEYYQYFVKEMNKIDIPYIDFTGKTREEMEAYLDAETFKAVKIFKDDVIHGLFFTAWDGRDGIFFNVSHLIVDLFGMVNFYNDLLDVYSSLMNNSELPAPMASYEQSLERELKIKHSDKTAIKVNEFVEKTFSSENPIVYSGIDGGRLLAAERKKRKDEKWNTVQLLQLLHTRTGNAKLFITPERLNRINEFCKANQLSLPGIVCVGLHTWLSAINNNQTRIYMQTMVHRRARLDTKRQGGCYFGMLPLIVDVHGDYDAIKAVESADLALRDLFSYIDVPFMEISQKYSEIEAKKFGYASSSNLFTVVPPDMIRLPENYKVELCTTNPGNATAVSYFLNLPSVNNGGMNSYFQYNTKLYTHEEAEKALNMAYEAVDIMIAEPELTMDQIKARLLEK